MSNFYFWRCYATRLLALNSDLWLAAHANPAMTISYIHYRKPALCRVSGSLPSGAKKKTLGKEGLC
jgi:hypothetical protein